MLASSPQPIDRRAAFLYILFILALLALIARLIYLQVIRHEAMSARARAQQTRTLDLSNLRGEIRDRHGRELAISLPASSLYAQPQEFRRGITPVARKLSEVLGEKPSDWERRLTGRSFRWLKRQIDPTLADRVLGAHLRGIGVLRETRRVYPLGSLGASLIGFVGVDNQGLAGVEYAFDSVLRGRPKQVNILTDGHGHELLRVNEDSLLDSLETQFQQVILTLDETVQHIAERELAEGMRMTQSLRGLVVIMDPRNGDLLALATQPGFDPNAYQQADWNVIKNWAVTDTYEPGSTMKVFTIAAALEHRRIRPSQEFACPGQIQVGGWPIHDHNQDPQSVRYLTTYQIMEHSSNVGASLIAATMPIREHFEQLSRFGFGRSTDSGLGGEVSGAFPPRPWVPISQATVAYGQGISVTPIQILSAIASIANRGVRMKPRVVDRMLDPNGQVVRTFPPRSLGTTLSSRTLAPLIDMLTRVIESPQGTGYLARMPEYQAAGKTGTADKVVAGRYTSQVISSFIGFAPVDHPEIVALVLFDRPLKNHWASESAAPVWGRTVRQVLRYLKVKPTRRGVISAELSPAVPRRNPKQQKVPQELLRAPLAEHGAVSTR